MASSSNKLGGSLKERAKERIKMRGAPNFESFDHYKDVRTSCWIVEETSGNFYYDCHGGMKVKQCWHEVGLMYKKGTLEVTSEVRSIPIAQRNYLFAYPGVVLLLIRLLLLKSQIFQSKNMKVMKMSSQNMVSQRMFLSLNLFLGRHQGKESNCQPQPQSPVVALLSQAKA